MLRAESTSWKDTSLSAFQGKALVGGLAGYKITEDDEDAQALRRSCQRYGHQIFLQAGGGFLAVESFPLFTPPSTCTVARSSKVSSTTTGSIDLAAESKKVVTEAGREAVGAAAGEATSCCLDVICGMCC